MAITAQQLMDARDLITQAGNVRAAATALRQRFPELRALVLDAGDMRGETPALTTGPCALYLMSTDGHCWTVTGDPAEASAVILTEH